MDKHQCDQVFITTFHVQHANRCLSCVSTRLAVTGVSVKTGSLEWASFSVKTLTSVRSLVGTRPVRPNRLVRTLPAGTTASTPVPLATVARSVATSTSAALTYTAVCPTKSAEIFPVHLSAPAKRAFKCTAESVEVRGVLLYGACVLHES